MSSFARRLSSALLVALLVPAFAMPATARTFKPFAMPEVSVIGSYLAGQRALADLNTDDAAQFFRAAAEDNWDDPVLVERAFIALAANGDIDRAATAAKHLLDLGQGNEIASLVIATQALKERRYGAAIGDLDSVGNDSFIGLTGAILRAWAYTGDGRNPEGIAYLDKTAGEGMDEFLTFHRAMLFDVAGDSEAAIAEAKRAYELGPGMARAVEAYARMLANAGRFDEAIDVVVQFEAQGFTHPLVDSLKGALAKKQRPGLFASSVQAGAAEMYHSIAVNMARDGSGIDVPVVFLRLALYLDPNADIISMVLAQILDNNGQHDTANAIYERIPATSPLKATAVVRIAQNLEVKGDRKEAIRRLTNIAASQPNDLEAVTVLGEMLRYDEQYDKSVIAFDQAIKLTGGNRPADWRLFYLRGIAYERGGDWKKAEGDFLKALELNPDQPQVLNYLGYTWVDQGVKLDEALDMIQRAVQAAPNDGYIKDSLGWAFYKMGNIEQAVEILEGAVQMSPNDPDINDHLGDAYLKAGRVREARFQWAIAVAVDKAGVVSERVKPKLAQGPETSTTQTP